MIGEKTDLSFRITTERYDTFGYQCKRHIHKRRTLQRLDGTNVGRYKRRTSTNVRTGTFIRRNVGLWLSLKKKANAIRNKIFKSHTYCEKNQRQLNKVSSFEGSTV